MTFTATSFWYQAALNAVGPLVTAIAVTLLAGLLVNFITRASQDRRAENQLRYELISQIIETASTLYHHITLYMRARPKTDAESVDSARDNGPDSNEPDQLRNKLREEYPVSRARAEVIQARLKIYFQEPRVEVAWHAVRDCPPACRANHSPSFTVRLQAPSQSFRRHASKGWVRPDLRKHRTYRHLLVSAAITISHE